MPHQGHHRGMHPDDPLLFSEDQVAGLRKAVHDLSWLLSEGYATRSALALVGDRFQLTLRQRLAVQRCSCSRLHLEVRKAHQVHDAALRDEPLVIDGFNLLITMESLLSGGVLLHGLDGCIRDLAGIHGNYRPVAETESALQIIGEHLAEVHAGPIIWLFDRPVSNSGKIRTLVLETASRNQWHWSVDLVFSPDHVLSETDAIVISSDGVVLNTARRWYNFTATILKITPATGRVLDLTMAET